MTTWRDCYINKMKSEVNWSLTFHNSLLYNSQIKNSYLHYQQSTVRSDIVLKQFLAPVSLHEKCSVIPSVFHGYSICPLVAVRRHSNVNTLTQTHSSALPLTPHVLRKGISTCLAFLINTRDYTSCILSLWLATAMDSSNKCCHYPLSHREYVTVSADSSVKC